MAQPVMVYEMAGSGVARKDADTLTLKVPPFRAATEACDCATLAASSARPQTSAASENPARGAFTRRSYHGPAGTRNESPFQLGRFEAEKSGGAAATRPCGRRPDTSSPTYAVRGGG